MNIRVRKAEADEITWINSCYDTVEFLHSDLGNEVVAIAEVDNQRAGLGRLVKVGDDIFELGGMLVFEQYRGLGLSKKIIEFLIKQATCYKAIYCIPFEHLDKLYYSMGFNNCNNFTSVPEKVIDKYNWCKSHYPHNVLLLEINS
ncbi:MAG: GNAT family N-acetyltransferase [Acidobacteriota bacterium]